MPAPDPLALLKSVFGFDAFRPGQREIVDAVTAGRDVLAIMPTGGGKSLCYQLPALMRDGLTVVVSPLIALMRDQVSALRAAGVEAGALTSANAPEETEAVFAALDARRLKLLYMAPERVAVSGALLRRAGVSLIAVDEAHCVSQWGHDFRPDYLRVGELRRTLAREGVSVQTAAFTATADEGTRAEIVAKLFDAAPVTFLRGFDRPNLHLAFRPKDQPRKQLLDFCTARKGRSGVVYAASRNKTEVLAKALQEAGVEALPYHAGLDPATREANQDRFARDDLVMVATIAFGMGVDKPDIRFVAHADLPKSIESYYQEIGRAGRDGAPAETLTLYGVDDIRLRRLQIDESLAPDERKRADHARLDALLALAEAPVCRRVNLLAYFGETYAPPCGACDLCQSPPRLFDATVAAQKALSAILRTGERFGAGHLIDVLRGEGTDKVRARGHDRLPTFGVGRELDARQWRGLFRQLYALGLLRTDPEHGGFQCAEPARAVLKGERRLELREDALKPARGETRPQPKALVAEGDEALFAALKAKRRALAEAQNAPAYIVFPDRVLIEMASRRPRSLDEMARIPGVGAKKLQSYGRAFLEVVSGAPEPAPHPARAKLAARGGGALFDRLEAAAVALARGPAGADKPLALPRGTLAKIARTRPRDRAALESILGAQKADRFADAFLAVIAESDSA